MSALLVALGGGLGALLRFRFERWSVHRFGERIPWGTALANLLGALVIGLLAGAAPTIAGVADAHQVYLLLGTGFCGGLTTFGGFMGQVENRLRHKASRRLALAYLAGITLLGIIVVIAMQGLGRQMA